MVVKCFWGIVNILPKTRGECFLDEGIYFTLGTGCESDKVAGMLDVVTQEI